MTDDRITAAIDGNDLDELLRLIDALCATRDWDALVELRMRSRRAFERGRQLWPAAAHAEYRLALEAPASVAATVVEEDAGRFAPGPLPEVVASTHTWADLAPYLPASPRAALVAHERVVRGDDLRDATVAHADVLGVPLVLARWEPAYPLATYRADRGEFPSPAAPRGKPLALPAAANVEVVAADDASDALLAVVRPWTVSSGATVRALAVQGSELDAIAALGVGAARGARVAPAEAMALLAWAGASGGAHGRRRGTAAGRDLAWAAATALGGFPPDEPPEADALGEALEQLRFLWWSGTEPDTGWVVRLAVADERDGLAWALDARDEADGGPASAHDR